MAYFVAVVIFEPDYLTGTVPLITAAYGAFGTLVPETLVMSVAAFILAAPMLIRARGVSGTLVVGALAFFLVFIIQAKGFNYQAAPAIGLLALSFAAAPPPQSPIRWTLTLTAIFMAVAPGLIPRFDQSFTDDLMPAGTSFAALSTSPRVAWPEVETRHLKYPMSSMSLWMSLKKPEVARQIALHDLGCNPPEYLWVQNEKKFNYYKLVPEILKEYRVVDWGPGGTLYQLAGTLPTPAHCRIIY
jgi:hypothetical protein